MVFAATSFSIRICLITSYFVVNKVLSKSVYFLI